MRRRNHLPTGFTKIEYGPPGKIFFWKIIQPNSSNGAPEGSLCSGVRNAMSCGKEICIKCKRDLNQTYVTYERVFLCHIQCRICKKVSLSFAYAKESLYIICKRASDQTYVTRKRVSLWHMYVILYAKRVSLRHRRCHICKRVSLYYIPRSLYDCT